MAGCRTLRPIIPSRSSRRHISTSSLPPSTTNPRRITSSIHKATLPARTR
jgi:hypothetical protein